MEKKYIPKKQPADIRTDNLQEPTLDNEERKFFDEGIRLFNARKYWEAHECWETVWRRRPEESRIFFQGIIQAAAGFHLLVERSRPNGARKNLVKSLEKLRLFRNQFLGIDVLLLQAGIQEALESMERSSEVKLPML